MLARFVFEDFWEVVVRATDLEEFYASPITEFRELLFGIRAFL